MKQFFWPGALTATGPGCRSPQNKGKCVGGRSVSAVFFQMVQKTKEVRVKYLYRGFDLTLQLSLQWVWKRKAQDLRQVILFTGLERERSDGKKRILQKLLMQLPGHAEYRCSDGTSPSLPLSVGPEPVVHVYLYGKSKTVDSPSTSLSSSSAIQPHTLFRFQAL